MNKPSIYLYSVIIDLFKFIAKGKMCVVKGKNQIINVIEKGQVFGEIALIYNCDTTAMIRADSEECWFWALSRNDF